MTRVRHYYDLPWEVDLPRDAACLTRSDDGFEPTAGGRLVIANAPLKDLAEHEITADEADMRRRGGAMGWHLARPGAAPWRVALYNGALPASAATWLLETWGLPERLVPERRGVKLVPWPAEDAKPQPLRGSPHIDDLVALTDEVLDVVRVTGALP